MLAWTALAHGGRSATRRETRSRSGSVFVLRARSGGEIGEGGGFPPLWSRGARSALPQISAPASAVLHGLAGAAAQQGTIAAWRLPRGGCQRKRRRLWRGRGSFDATDSRDARNVVPTTHGALGSKTQFDFAESRVGVEARRRKELKRQGIDACSPIPCSVLDKH